MAGGDVRPVLDGWKARSPLVRVPFLVAPDYRILWPTWDESGAGDERAFLDSNREFVTDQAAIPYFQNIALVYKDQLLSEEAKPASAPAEGDRFKQVVVRAPVVEPSAAPSSSAGLSREAVAADAKRDKLSEVQTEQRAVAEFERSPDLRQRVYDEAAVKGQQTQARTVTPGLTPSPQKSEAPGRPPASIFISELRSSARSRPGGAPG